MATAAAQDVRKPEYEGFEERLDPKFFEFKNAGDAVGGKLIAIEKVEVGEKKQTAIRYTVHDLADDALYSFLGSYQINTKIRREDLGKLIVVRYEGEDRNVVRNGNAMKVFKVFVEKPKPGAVKNAHGLEITDDDIGF